MSTPRELERELNERLIALAKEVAEDRQFGISRTDIQTTMNRFHVNWCMRLFTEWNSQVAERRVEIEDAEPKIGADGALAEPDRSLRIIENIRKAEDAIEQQITQLRDGMVRGLQEIDQGREPQLIFLPVLQIEKEAFEALVRDKQLGHEYEM